MFFDLVKIGIRTCQLPYQIVLVAWLASLAVVHGQSCPPKESEMKVISNFLNQKLNEIRKYKPGTNPKDAEFIIYRIAKDVTTNNKFAPCNNGFSWQQVETDANQIKEDCFKPGDYTKPEPQQAIMNCANKYYPQFLIKYGKQGLESCACFSKYIVPNWKSRYQKYANDYVEEFKTLRHRKMTIAKIRGN